MIRKATIADWPRIQAYVSKDYARNYFIALGLLKGPETFDAIYIDEGDQIDGMLFCRASGNLQFISYEHYDATAMQQLIQSLEFKYLISPESFSRKLKPAIVIEKEGAVISSLTRRDYQVCESDVCDLNPEDCDGVEVLYSKVFPGYPKADFMRRKLIDGRGIGVAIKRGEIISVAQSDFGYVIVGVATLPEFQHQGYARQCMHGLMQRLFQSEETLYLQYDSKIAGKLYEDLGFQPIDQVNHYIKR